MKLFEIKKTKVKTKEDPVSKLRAEFFKQPQFHAPEEVGQRDVAKPKSADVSTTHKKMADVELPPEAAGHIASLAATDLQDEISDEEAAARAGTHLRQHHDGATTKNVDHDDVGVLNLPKTPENLPAILSKQVAKSTPIEPEWHMVKNLPGYIRNPIRAMGRAVFKVFTRTPIEDIQVVANLQNSGPNTKTEMNAMAHWILHHGHPISDANLDFSQSMPGYDADVKLYHALGYSFLIVKDFAGHYIYSWPLSHDKSFKSQERLS